ncbi:MAG: SDR family NAD(P)-dependent oxidoreductase [Nitrospinota bacterium]|nr:SDR family oxidoreductase [Nitrospinota bacterium]
MSTAIITGGAVRLGKEFALHLAKEGYNVAILYNSSKREAEDTLAEIKGLGVTGKGYQFELRNVEGIPSLMNEILHDFKDVSILINSASIFPKASIAETEIKDMYEAMDVNLFAPFILMREYYRKVKKGNIINILDERIATNSPTRAAYLLSKSALERLTYMAAIEFAPDIRVNGIAPGLILQKEGVDTKYFAKRSKDVPMGRSGGVDSLLTGIDYLLNNQFVTGEVLYIDGGESKG